MILSSGADEIVIRETVHHHVECYKITTPSAVYILEKNAGGFSSLIDRDGCDWIQFKKLDKTSYPASAAGDYRGVPNLVFKSEDGGAGHPGFDICTSTQVDANTIRTVSHSGQWQWSWSFFNDYARLTVEKVDPSHAYWFLYEGPIADTFDPNNHYWGTNTSGPRFEKPDLYNGTKIIESWQWAYFGDRSCERVLFVAQQHEDEHPDFFSYLGNTEEGIGSPDGMVVFGFGRAEKATPLMQKINTRFCIGFFEKKIVDLTNGHALIKKHIETILENNMNSNRSN